MSIGVSSEKGALGCLPRSSIDTDNAAHFKLFEGTGSTLSDSLGNIGDLTLSGSSSHHWTNSGWFTGSDAVSVGNRYAKDADTSTANAMMRTDNITAGGLVVAMSVYSTVKTVGTKEVCLSFGSSAGSNAYWRLENLAAGTLQFAYGASGNFSYGSVAVGEWNASTTQSVVFWVDRANSLIHSYANGNTTELRSAALATAHPAPVATRGFTIGGDGTGLSTAANIIGTSNARDFRIGNILIVRSSSDMSSIISDIVKTHHQNRGDLPWSIDGLT